MDVWANEENTRFVVATTTKPDGRGNAIRYGVLILLSEGGKATAGDELPFTSIANWFPYDDFQPCNGTPPPEVVQAFNAREKESADVR